MSIIKEVNKIDTHTLKGGYSTLKDLLKFKTASYERVFSVKEFEEFLLRYEGVLDEMKTKSSTLKDEMDEYQKLSDAEDDIDHKKSLYEKFNKHYSIEKDEIQKLMVLSEDLATLTELLEESNDDIVNGVNQQFNLFAELLSQKEVLEEKLNYLPNLKFKKGFYELDVNNKITIDAIDGEFQMKKYELGVHKIAKFAKLYFTSGDDTTCYYLSKFKILNGIQVSQSFADYLSENYKKEGFSRLEDKPFIGSFGYEGYYEPIQTVKVKKDFLKKYYHHNKGEEIFTMPSQSDVSNYYEIEESNSENNQGVEVDEIDKLFSTKEVRKKVDLAELCNCSSRIISLWCKDYDITNSAKGVNMREFARFLRDNRQEEYKLLLDKIN